MEGAPINGSNLPDEYTVGGQLVKVKIVNRCNDNCLGESNLAAGAIEISKFFNKDSEQSDSSKLNTFYHELVHTILEVSGYKDLNWDEKFVCTFAGFLTEAITTMKYE